MCKRGDVYFADLGENIGSCKQGGFRPVLVVSNNRANEHSPVITIVPLTARVYKKRQLPTHVFIPRWSAGLNKHSMALAEQVETIDKNRQKLLYSTQNIQDPKTKLFLYYLFRNCTLLKIAKVNIKINVI